jgi:hypothetical protein
MGKGRRLKSVMNINNDMVDLLVVNVNVNLSLQCRDQTNTYMEDYSNCLISRGPLTWSALRSWRKPDDEAATTKNDGN